MVSLWSGEGKITSVNTTNNHENFVKGKQNHLLVGEIN